MFSIHYHIQLHEASNERNKAEQPPLELKLITRSWFSKLMRKKKV